MKYTQEQFVAAFDKVADKTHWKNPIHAVVNASENLHLIREAIIHFTATVPTFDILKVTEEGTKVLVRAVGYRNGPAGDDYDPVKNQAVITEQVRQNLIKGAL